VTVGDLPHDVVLDGEQVLVGRLAECQIRLSDANVSRRHAAFIPVDDGWAVTDLDSTNGTYVNGERVKRARLRDGDVIEIGLTRLVYHEPRR
jgi:pSer/pThr/pTyr-binding forkhead associated (FHA) protein